VSWRWNSHIQASRHLRRCSFVDRAIAKYGSSAFTVQEISEHFTQEDLNNAERVAIIVFSSLDHKLGFNLRTGGSQGKHSKESCIKIGNAHRGKIVSSESRAKTAASSRGRKMPPRTEQHRTNLSFALMGNQNCKGNNHSDETKAKISAIHKGIPKSAQHRKRLSEVRTGTHPSNETRAKLSAMRRGKPTKPPSLETRDKMRMAKLGNKLPQSQKDKMSASQKIAWVQRKENHNKMEDLWH